jgi:ATP synthase protein I
MLVAQSSKAEPRMDVLREALPWTIFLCFRIRIPMQPEKRPETAARRASDLSRHSSLGMQFAAAIIAFAALGWFLDRELGSTPWLLITGVFVGFGGGMVSLLKKIGPPTGGSGPKHPSTPSRLP